MTETPCFLVLRPGGVVQGIIPRLSVNQQDTGERDDVPIDY